MPFFSLENQTAIVTGGATGIGEAIAQRLAKAGATVVIADINIEAAEATAKTIPGAIALKVDITDPASTDAATAEIIKRTGRIDVLVNNAGIAGKAAPITEQTLDDWHKCIAVNMDGVFNFVKSVLPHMKEKQYGRIVSIASIAGKEGNPNMVAYSATKAAVIGFTKSIGKEVATQGITVNAVAPAVVQTKILDQLTPEQVGYMTAKIPMGRTGKPDEIAAVVHFLASPDSSFVTGQCYDASGGRATY
ncbi:3-oxoacyl-ACP reductase [Bryobacterales bacterium F-183]|nr:3-oxoacyl-ACP reductase [Bryobacterales bacterium F-183]